MRVLIIFSLCMVWGISLYAQDAPNTAAAFIAARYQAGDVIITDAHETEALSQVIAGFLPDAEILTLTQAAYDLPQAPQLFFIHTNPEIHVPDQLGIQYTLLENAHFGEWQIWVYRRTPGQLQPLARFGDAVWLMGWRLDRPARLKPCDTVILESWWQITAPVPMDYSMTLTLNNLWGTGLNRTDGAPANSQMRLWQPGQFVVDKRELMLPCDVPPGEYFLVVGIYDWTNNESLPVFPDGYYRAHLTGFRVSDK
jgi:hypothetical protein